MLVHLYMPCFPYTNKHAHTEPYRRRCKDGSASARRHIVRVCLMFIWAKFPVTGLFCFQIEPRRAFFCFHLPAIEFFICQFPRFSFHRACKSHGPTPTDCLSSLMIYPDRSVVCKAKYLYRPIVRRKKYI
jgi:hypothetical protein